jgi:hypothetical protein
MARMQAMRLVCDRVRKWLQTLSREHLCLQRYGYYWRTLST